MQLTKKQEKETKIVEAAENVFGKIGFKNAKMEDIAKEAGITKVTLYSYFQSKENLYLAVTYRALRFLIDDYYETIEKYRDRPGIESSVALLKTFMDFCEKNYLYSEALLNYFALVRSTSGGQDQSKMTDAEIKSMYYMKLRDIHNLPFKLTANEIKRGIQDQSITADIDPMFHTLMGWSLVVGYAKILAASGANATPLFNIHLHDLKEYNLDLTSKILRGK